MSAYPTKPAADSCREEEEKEEWDTFPSSLADQGPSSASTDSWALVDVSALSSLSTELPRHGGRQKPSAPLTASPLESFVTCQPIAAEASEKPGTSAYVYMTQEEFKKMTEKRQEEIRRTMSGMKEASKVYHHCTFRFQSEHKVSIDFNQNTKSALRTFQFPKTAFGGYRVTMNRFREH